MISNLQTDINGSDIGNPPKNPIKTAADELQRTFAHQNTKTQWENQLLPDHKHNSFYLIKGNKQKTTNISNKNIEPRVLSLIARKRE